MGNRCAWEVDWTRRRGQNNSGDVWARNPLGHTPASRAWHWTSLGYLRGCGISTPTYRADSWEIDWGRRKGKLVWGRNLASKMPSARAWHWMCQTSVQRAGFRWKPAKTRSGKFIDANGYVVLSRVAMTAEDIAIATTCGLWKGTRNAYCPEHRLVAAKHYGGLARGSVVRHLNGDKTDNRPGNLVPGTVKENATDHKTATMNAMYWKRKYEALAASVVSGEALRTTELALSTS